MRQFDLFRNPSDRQSALAPYFVVLSSHHLRSLDEVIVAPLLRNWSRALNEVDIVVDCEGERLLLAVSELFSIRAGTLKTGAGDLADMEDDIRRALERLFSGF